MNGQVELITTFGSDEDCAEGIEALHHAQLKDFRAFMPFPSEHILAAANQAHGWRRSPVRWWVLLGGISGIITAILVTIGTSLEWNLNTGGRPIASIPPYIIIMFELMVLFGGLSGVAGFFVHNRMPIWDPDPAYRTRFGADRFGLVVRCPEADAGKVESMLRECGAQDITRAAA